ncbi:MAG: hypothetical protein GY920_17315, partial [Aliivibrio sp.]|nr:hypothetical protein [Aliivibrio sp.]
LPVVSGDNSATVIEDAQDFLPDGETFNGQFTKVTGNVIADDIDLGDEVVSWQVSNGSGVYGIFTIDANGQWIYLLDNTDPDTNALNFGDIKTEIFQVTATDKHGGVSEPFDVTITIEGNTDPDGGGGGSYDETINIDSIEEGVDGDGDAIGGDSSGTIDLPSGCEIISVDGTSSVDGGLFGSLTVDNNGNWVYDVADDKSYVDSLCEGQKITEKWAVTVQTDCGPKTILVNVTITGSNDIPVIVADTPTGERGEVVEDDLLEVSGQLEVVDPDTCDSHAWYLVDVDGNKIGAVDSSGENIVIQGTYGELTLNQATGDWTYVLDNDNPLVQALTPDQIEKEYVRVVVEDDKGAVSADSTININVIGVADDVPAVEIIEQIEFKED